MGDGMVNVAMASLTDLSCAEWSARALATGRPYTAANSPGVDFSGILFLGRAKRDLQ